VSGMYVCMYVINEQLDEELDNSAVSPLGVRSRKLINVGRSSDG
jgi:hypothetical protein